jgi:hypothetical protein
MMRVISPRRSEEHMCTVRVNNTFENLSAHVEMDGDVKIEPGDEVVVHGRPLRVPYGGHAEERRKATIRRAGWAGRLWTRLTGDLEFMELLEFSFSAETKL